MTRAVLVCPLALACTVARPFEGPGWTEEEGLVTSAEGPFVVVATHTRAKGGNGGAFDDNVAAIEEQLEQQPGFVGSSLRGRLPGRERWTLTVWESEEAIHEFVISGAHLEAMVDQGELIDGVVSTTWTVEAEELPPSWDDAVERLPDPTW